MIVHSFFCIYFIGDLMDNFYYSFIISFLAGFSTLFGFFIIFFKGNKDNIILSSLSFAAGVMICVSLTDLIPSSFEMIFEYFYLVPAIIILFIFFSVGVIFSMLVDKYLPNNDNSSLYKVGIFSMIAIILHNIPEGILTFLSSSNNLKLGISLAIAISFHNIPEGISIAIPIFFSTNKRSKAFIYTLISGFSEPMGALFAYFFLSNNVNNLILGFLFSFTAGIMIQISCYELIPVSLKYKNFFRTLVFFIIGFLFMLLSHLILG